MASPNGFTGTVTGGTSHTYTVDVDGGGSETVHQMQIDNGETIPAGTKVVLVLIGGSYYMQVPVFLGDT